MARSTFSGLNTVVRGITNNQLSLDTVGHNIANADTEGYSRQRVNSAATRALDQYGMYGKMYLGTGVDAESITRARDVYADRQYWLENATNSYYAAQQKNYQKVQSVFNDSNNNGILDSLQKFYQSWQSASDNASNSSARIGVVEQGKQFAEHLRDAASGLSTQINEVYRDFTADVDKVNSLTDQIVNLNKNIAVAEASGGMANDLRDQRDLLTDQLSGYISLNVYTNPVNGMYQIVSNGASLVNGVSKLNLQLAGPTNNPVYGVNDYSLIIQDTRTPFQPGNGTLQSHLDSIATDKGYIDNLASMGAYMMSSLNAVHRMGAGIDANNTTDLNFYGDSDRIYVWDNDKQTLFSSAYTHTSTTANGVTTSTDTLDNTDQQALQGIEILAAMQVNTELTANDGEKKLALRGFGANGNPNPAHVVNGNAVVDNQYQWTNFQFPAANATGANNVVQGTLTHTYQNMNGTADNSIGEIIGSLFNMEQPTITSRGANGIYSANNGAISFTRPIGTQSLNSYYNVTVSALGFNAEAMNNHVTYQQDVMVQIENWRTSIDGVNWNEELSNMIKFQKGYSASARCLTTMDEMLDRLINSTGMVGR